MKAPQSHLKGRCVYVKKADCESSGVTGIRHGCSPSKHFPALLSSVQGGTAVSSGEAPLCSHGQLSARLMHPLSSSTQWVNPCCWSLALSLPFCFMYSYQCVSSVSSWLRELSAVTYGGVSVLSHIIATVPLA